MRMDVREVPVYVGSFSREIEAHLELQMRNSGLEASLPIAAYRDTVAAEINDVALASRGVAAEIPEADPPTQTTVGGAPWDDGDSWWNVREPFAGWAH
jgi:hypothetical protein